MVGTIALPLYIHLIYISPPKTSLSTKPGPFQIVQIAFDVFSGMASVFILTVISFERVCAIFCPLRYRSLSKATYLIVLTEVWILAGALTGIWLLTVFDFIHHNIFAYSLAILSFTSLTLMIASYVALWLKIKIWSRKTQQRATGEKERNLAMAIAIITAVFLLTWSPFHIMNILINFKKSLLDGIPYEAIYFAKFLHYSNSIVNPVIYCYKISEFRRALKSLISRKQKKRETRVWFKFSKSWRNIIIISPWFQENKRKERQEFDSSLVKIVEILCLTKRRITIRFKAYINRRQCNN